MKRQVLHFVMDTDANVNKQNYRKGVFIPHSHELTGAKGKGAVLSSEKL